MAAEERKHSHLDYKNTAFILQEPYKSHITKGPFRLKNRDEHKKLILTAKSKGLYIWFGAIIDLDGRKCLSHHRLIDWESVPEPGKLNDESESLNCIKCGKVCSSSSGLTLHQSSCAGKANTEFQCETCGYKCSSRSGLTLHTKHRHGRTTPANLGTTKESSVAVVGEA